MVQHAHTRRAALAAASILAVLLSLAAVFAVTRQASAASTGATTTAARATLTLNGAGGKSLNKAGVTFTAAKKASLRKTTLTLPVSVAVVGGTAAVGLHGTLTFKAGKRKVTLTGLRVMVSKKRVVEVLAKTTGGQFPVLTGAVKKSALTLDAFTSTASFTATSVKLTPKAAKLLKTTLKLRRTPSGTLGALTLLPASKATPGGTTTTPTTPGSGTPGTTIPGTTTPGSTTPTTPTTPTPGTGPKACTATTPANSAVSEPNFDQPKPLNAVDVQSACITWHPRDSWTDYTFSGPTAGDGAAMSNGATAEAANTACGALLPRDFHFQFHRGWFVPSTGEAALQYDGTVRYRYQQHGIDVSFRNPEIQVGGATAIARFRPATGDRLTVLNLDQSAPTPKICPADPGPRNSHDPTGISGPRTYERLRTTIAPTGSAMFDSGGQGGAYPAGDDFGWLSVSFTPAS